MVIATVVKELWLETTNTVGTIAKITAPIAEANVNIKALWGGIVGDKGTFSIITEDNTKALDLLQKVGIGTVVERDVVLVKVPNEVGACWNVTKKIGDAGVNVNHIYVTTINNEASVVVSVDDTQKVVGLLS